MGFISDGWVSAGHSPSGSLGGKKKMGLMWSTNQGAATPTRAEFVGGSTLPSVKTPVVLNKSGGGSVLSGVATSPFPTTPGSTVTSAVKAPVVLNKGGAGSGLSGAASSIVSGAKNIVDNMAGAAGAGANQPAVTGQNLDANGQTDYSKLIRQGMASGASADAVQAWLDSRMAKIAGAGGALDQYAYDPLSQAAQAYISFKRQPQYDSYEDFYDQGGYADAAARRQSILDAQIRQLENYYAGQRSDINSDAEEQARQAYIAYMQGRNTMPQALAASGYTGGMADSQQLALELGYQNNQRAIAQARAAALNDLTTALNDARLSASLEGLQAQDDIMREAVAAYQNWQNQRDAAVNQNWLTFLDYDMQEQQAAQQNDRSLANQLALLEAQNRYDTETAARENEEAKLLTGAQLLAGIGDNEALGQYYGWTPEKVAAMDAYFQSQADQAAAKAAADEQSVLWDMAIDALKEGDPSLYVQMTGNTGFGKYINDLNNATLAAKLKTGSGPSKRYLSPTTPDDEGLDLTPTVTRTEASPQNMLAWKQTMNRMAAEEKDIQSYMNMLWDSGQITEAQMAQLQDYWNNTALKLAGK